MNTNPETNAAVLFLQSFLKKHRATFEAITKARQNWRIAEPLPLEFQKLPRDVQLFRVALIQESMPSYTVLLNQVLTHIEVCGTFSQELEYVMADVPELLVPVMQHLSRWMDRTATLGPDITHDLIGVALMDQTIQSINLSSILERVIALLVKYCYLASTV